MTNRPFPTLPFKATCKIFLGKMKVICSRIKNHVQINGFALSLALKQRLGANLEMVCCHLDSYSLPPRDNAATYNQFQPRPSLTPCSFSTVFSKQCSGLFFRFCHCTKQYCRVVGGKAAKPVVNRVTRENSPDTS